MKVTRDVVTDLLPLYFAGEASADTRALVEEFFAQDPEFARLARTQTEDLLPAEAPLALPKETEMKALERTKKLLKLRSAMLGAAVFLTLLPLSFRFDESGVYWLAAQRPALAGGALVLAAGGWMAYLAVRRRLGATGL